MGIEETVEVEVLGVRMDREEGVALTDKSNSLYPTQAIPHLVDCRLFRDVSSAPHPTGRLSDLKPLTMHSVPPPPCTMTVR